jgi:hypothetical protein
MEAVAGKVKPQVRTRVRELGKGVIAICFFSHPSPSCFLLRSEEDRFIVLSSDGLYAEEARGGGGGLENAQVGPCLGWSVGDKAKSLRRTQERSQLARPGRFATWRPLPDLAP